MVNKKFFIIIFIIGEVIYGQNLQQNPMDRGQYFSLSDIEKINYVKTWFIEGINVPKYTYWEFFKAGGKDIIPWLLEELPKHEFYRSEINNDQLDFIFNVLVHFRLRDQLTLYERYYIASILEAKIINYIIRYKQIDMLVLGINSNIWMYIKPTYNGQLSDELIEILNAKYRAMGLLD